MDTLISLSLLAVVLTPLYFVVRDLMTARSRRSGAELPLTHGPMSAMSTFPSLAMLEDMEDTMPACLRRTDWNGTDA